MTNLVRAMNTGVFSSEDRADFVREALKVLPSDGVIWSKLDKPSQLALFEAAMIGSSLALFAAKYENLAPIAQLCEVPSRRALFRIMRAMCQDKSEFRLNAIDAGSRQSESEIRSHLVTFSRNSVKSICC